MPSQSGNDLRAILSYALVLAVAAVAAILLLPSFRAQHSDGGPARPTRVSFPPSPPTLAGREPPVSQPTDSISETDQGGDGNYPVNLKVTGEVIDATSGSPVSEARVALVPEGSFFTSEWVPVCDDGSFALEAPAEKDARIVVVSPGHVAWEETDPLCTARHLTVVLNRGAEIVGIVSDDLGNPLEGVDVWSTTHRSRMPWPGPDETVFRADESTGGRARTDESGRFAIWGNAPGRTYQIGLRKAHYTPGQRPPQVEAGVAGELTLMMRALCRIRLFVFDQDSGEPVQGLTMGGSQPKAGALAVAGTQKAFIWDLPSADGAHYIVLARDATSELPADGPPTTIVDLRAPGYRRKTLEIPLERFGAVQERRVMMIKDGVNVAFRIRAAWPDGTPFEGSLRLCHGVFSQDVRFVDGSSVDQVSLPEDVRSFWFRGADVSATWWDPANRRFALSEVRDGWLSLPVCGGFVALEVLELSGARATSFALTVMGEVPVNVVTPGDFMLVGASQRCSLETVGAPSFPFLVLHPGRYRVCAMHGDFVSKSEDIVIRSAEIVHLKLTMDQPTKGRPQR